jgi:hypothetical protein
MKELPRPPEAAAEAANRHQRATIEPRLSINTTNKGSPLHSTLPSRHFVIPVAYQSSTRKSGLRSGGALR